MYAYAYGGQRVFYARGLCKKLFHKVKYNNIVYIHAQFIASDYLEVRPRPAVSYHKRNRTPECELSDSCVGYSTT